MKVGIAIVIVLVLGVLVALWNYESINAWGGELFLPRLALSALICLAAFPLLQLLRNLGK